MLAQETIIQKDSLTLKYSIEKEIKELEKKFTMHEKFEYKNLVNFSTSDKYPIHRWYYYQEGYSPKLISNLIKEFNIKKGDNILDPFCGGGTTLLTAAQNNIRSVGFEINPFSAFCSKVKTRKYCKEEIGYFKKIINKMKKIDFKSTLPLPRYKMIDKLFDSDVLEKLMMYKEYILNLDNDSEKHTRDLLFLGWLSILEEVSNYRKGGNGLKKKNRCAFEKDVKRKLFSKYDVIYNDIRTANFYLTLEKPSSSFIKAEIYNNSAIKIRDFVNKNSIDSIIFSPPYTNCFDYCEVYKIELWMGDFVHSYEDMRKLRLKSLRSHVNIKWDNSDLITKPMHPLDSMIDFLHNQKLWNGHIPKMLHGYFTDMNTVFSSLFEVIKDDGKCAIVVGNSAYGNIIIPTDLLLAQIAEKSGFTCEEIRVARFNETSSQQQLKLGGFKKYLRESVVILNK